MIQKKSRGFTLLEVLVSATIIAVLTAIGIVSYSSVNKRSRDVKRKSDLEQIRSALEMYRADTGAYPNIGTTFSNTQNLSTDLVTSGYIPAIPDDPSSSGNYYYKAISSSGVYSSYCICADLETLSSATSTCTVALTAYCDYGLKSP